VAFAAETPVIAQQAAPPAGANEEMVSLNFPGPIDIKSLIEYVSTRQKIKIIYDETLATKKISIKAPGNIPASSLMPLLESALKIRGLALVDADVPGWKRLVSAEKLSDLAEMGDAKEAIEQYGKTTAVIQTFVLKHANAEDVNKIIEPFLTKPGGSALVLPDSKTLVVTDYATNLLKVARWIEFIDQPRPIASLEFLPVQNMEASALVTQLNALLQAKAKVEGGPGLESQIVVSSDARTNQLALIGQPEIIEQVKQLAKSLDVPLGLITRTYAFENVMASQIDQLMQQLIDPEVVQRMYRSAVDMDENLLIATTTEEIHRRIAELKETRDAPVKQTRSPVRFYKVNNLPVDELLATIRDIEQGSSASISRGDGWGQLPTNGRIRPARKFPVSGPNRLPPKVGDGLPTPPSFHETPDPQNPPPEDLPQPAPMEEEGASALGAPATSISELLGRARVTADARTNTLIVVAEPSVQRVYEELIKKLDQRPPQVLIESKFVIINTSDDFSLGVEISGGDRYGAKRLLAFTSYGLSTVDPVSGALSIIPGVGFNGTLVDPDVADAVIRALASHSRARVASSPRILVNDNATGQLTSVEEVPFTSVNASQTVATTSFAGFAEAGTTITVTPRISDDNHLQLDYAITLNTFTSGGSEGVPPPRQTEEVTSQVTIPDGHTVIVGGLRRGNHGRTYTGFPILEHIPILRTLTGSHTKNDSCSSMFVFMRATVLRDDKYRDLKYLSQRDLSKARMCGDMPSSKPILMQ